MLRITDPRSRARLCEAQHVLSTRTPLSRADMIHSMIPQITRREFLSHTTSLAAGAGLASALGCASLRTARKPLFEISIAEWSLHRALFDGKINHVDFPRTAKNDYGINAIELVNQFFKDKASDRSYLTDFKKRADDLGVRILLIMCDGEGALGDPNASGRNQAVVRQRSPAPYTHL